MPARRTLLTETPARVLAVYAHPDDLEVSAAGTVARWVRAGAHVELVVVAMGDKGSDDPTVDPGDLAQRRAGEVAASAAVLGLGGHEILGLPDGEIENTPWLRRELVARVRRARPDVVLCPDPSALVFGDAYVNHRDHRAVGEAVLDAVAPAAASPLYFPDAGPAHRVDTVLMSGTLAADVWVDVADVLGVKVEALACHRSQLGAGGEWLHDLVRQRTEEAGRRTGARHAEAFRRIRLGG